MCNEATEKGRAVPEYWTRRFDGCESECEPEPDRWAEGTRTCFGLSFSVDEKMLANRCHAAGCSPRALFTAAFAYLAAVFTGQEDVLFRTVPFDAGEAAVIPFRTNLSGQEDVVQLLRHTEEDLQEGGANLVPDYARLAHELGLTLPLLFCCGARATAEEGVVLAHDLPKNGVCRLELHYDDGRHSEGWARSFAGTYVHIVGQMLARDSLQDLVLVGERELDLLDAANQTEAPRDRSDVVAQFRRAASAHPDNTAIKTNAKSFSYAHMDQITDALAGYLREHGIGRGSVVSVLIHRNEFMPLASFGVLKSGAAYQPLDPTYPEERLSFMVQDAGSALLIADKDLAGLLEGWDGPVLFTDDIPRLPQADAFDAGIQPDDLCVLLYTSGSTGTPKGTVLRHGNLLELAGWAHDYFKMGQDSCYGAYASYGFDAHMIELYPVLTCGGTLCIVPDEIRLDLPAIGEYFNRNGVTISLMTTQVGRQFAQSYEGGSLRHLMVGGETLAPIDPTGLKVELFNAYGPTECTVLVTVQPVAETYHRVPIGKAVANVKLYVADRHLRRLPPFAPGELLIAGPHVSGGYLRLPEKTLSAFVPNPFSADPAYGSAYRTGDVVRMLPDGTVDFIGRRDSQVKVRGFRIELPEVETVIREYPDISDATVQAFADERTGMKYLAAYVVSGETVDVDGLKDFIREKKPPYMVPSVVMQLEAIPLTPNHKVDKKALPQPKRMTAGREAPASKEEELAYRCAAEALGHDDFGVTTDLEEAGLSSIASMRLNVLLSKAFGRSVRFADLAELRTVRQIAAFMRAAKKEESYELQTLYPLTSVQQGVYVDCLANPFSTTYNLPFLIQLDPAVDVPRLVAALKAVTDAHPYMKMRLTTSKDGEILAERHDEEQIPVGQVDKSELMHGFSSLVLPFPLTGGPLVRLTLVRDGSASWLFFDPHHLVFDGESLGIFFRDLERAYAGQELQREAFTGYEAALAERDLRNSAAYDKARDYFARLLSGRDTDCLPISDKTDSAAEPGFLSLDVSMSRQDVERTLREQRLTANALWNAAFGLTLSRFLARNDCVYATVYNGRNDSRLVDSVGMFVHTLPVACDLRDGEGGWDFVARIQRQLTESMSNDVYSFAEISRELNVNPGVMFVYQADLGEVQTVGGHPANVTALQPNAAKEPMVFFVFDTEDGYRLECEYEASRYEEWHMRSIMEGTAAAAQALVRNQRAMEASLLSEQAHDALSAFNRTERIVEDTDVTTLFRRAARKYPDHIAVTFAETSLTYRELDALSDRVATHVRCLGIGREDAVSILIGRSEHMAITALGVLKSGAAYQPLDPSYPSERLQYMIDDAHAKLLIADADLTHVLPGYDGPILRTQDIPSLPQGDAPHPKVMPEDLFVLLYTSGTTGQPKGVMLEHRNLVNFCDWYRAHYDLTADSVVAAYASFGFDACMMDLWPALTTGATVCIVPEELRLNLPELNRHFAKKGVTHVFMTTQMGRMFADGITGTTIRHLSVGGEKLAPLPPPEGYVLTNGYGPTECTIFSTTQPVDRLYERIPIGRPLSNYKLYVVDKDGHELPVGAVGELWIAGHGVGRGYLNRPEATSKAFVANPFCTTKGFDRAYRTGDLVRRLPDGRIDFVGRNDGQVKVRGFRIELTEVEGVIREYPGIRDVTVQAFDNEAAGGKYIAAYVVADKPMDFDRIGSFVLGKKPPYMVPAAWVQLDAIPLTQNQKVNRKALPLPALGDVSHEYVKPETPVEEELCNRFAQILGLPRVGATDSFFDLGGSSITAAEVVMFAMNRGYSIVYKDVFAHPSPRELAKVIAGANGGKRFDDVVDYDYSAIHDLMSMNTMEHVDEVSSREFGSVILTGATGFLGIHVLKAFLDSTDARITCLMRKGRFQTAEKRLKALLAYYFGEPMEELFGSRIFCLDGDITDPESLKALDSSGADVLINCAASVKHFVKDDLLDRVNYHGVVNLIDACLRNDMRLVQVSTLSVGGFIEPENRKALTEDVLFLGQNVDNDYVRTKFLAERAILEARVERGLDAVILRAGNLMSRNSDGEFQMNFKTNSFMRSLWAYVHLGTCPATVLEQPIEFSPIDAVAQAVLKLAGVDGRFSVFHMYNNHTITMADLVAAICSHGHQIDIVPEAEFQQVLSDAAKHAEDSGAVLSLVAYNNSEGENLVPVEAECRFTLNALFRLNFRWPIIGDTYLDKAIWALDTLGFFAGNI